MGKPVYKYPEFVKKVNLERTKNERFWLEAELDIAQSDSLVVILKNPSRADIDVADKTICNVLSYVYKNKSNYAVFKSLRSVIIVNLISVYETYSDRLKASKISVMNSANMKVIDSMTRKHQNVIVAWGNHPKGLYEEYENLKQEVFRILKQNKNNLHYVGSLSLSGNPKHGLIWGYEDFLKSFVYLVFICLSFFLRLSPLASSI